MVRIGHHCGHTASTSGRLGPVPSPPWDPGQRPDVAILVALPEEFRSLEAGYAKQWVSRRNPDHPGSDFLFLGPGGYRCVATIMPRMGPTVASQTSMRLLAWRPAVIINVGIAGGFKDDLRIGDVIVPRQIDAYDETGKVKADRWERRGSDYRPSAELLADVQELEFTAPEVLARWLSAGATQLAELREGADQARVDALLERALLRERPALSTNHLASGSFVVASKRFAEFIRATNADIHAGEMEAAGMMAAAEYRSDHVRTLVVRGISDHVDADKSELDAIGDGSLRRLAMDNAWRLVCALMELGVLPRAEQMATPRAPRDVDQPKSAPPSVPRAREDLRFVTSPGDIRRNISAFNAHAAGNRDRALKLIRSTSFWVFDPTEGRFGPSKFVGYEDMTFALYERASRGQASGTRFDGHLTRNQISKVLQAAYEPAGSRLNKRLKRWADILCGKGALDRIKESRWKYISLPPRSPAEIARDSRRQQRQGSDPDIRRQVSTESAQGPHKAPGPEHTTPAEQSEHAQPYGPKPGDRESIAARLDAVYELRDELKVAGQDTSEIDAQIQELRREQRHGPTLHAGEFLGNGRFRLKEVVGQGGFATVWRAYDRTTRESVAIKVLHGQFARDESRRERLFRGARKMGELQHPNVVRVLVPEGEEHGFYYYVMEYVAGGDLHQAVVSRRIDTEQALDVVVAIANVLEVAHERGFVHRDVKPQNILLRDDRTPALTDFDLVRVRDETGGTRAGAMGTFIYAAPEQSRDASNTDRRADVYALAMTAVFCIYGKGLPDDAMFARHEFIESLSCSDSLRGVLRKGLALKPEERHETMRNFRMDFARTRIS